ncbi:hypothetical protein VARIO8X_120290 [Burkholderiales bacterium 8X]|nr:hypothetical protein VARIO8X_120290 [Burkholderiales bacterium 8X]
MDETDGQQDQSDRTNPCFTLFGAVPAHASRWVSVADWCRTTIDTFHKHKVSNVDVHSFCVELTRLKVKDLTTEPYDKLLDFQDLGELLPYVGQALRELYLFGEPNYKGQIDVLLDIAVLGSHKLNLGFLYDGGVRFLCYGTGLTPADLYRRIVRMRLAHLNATACGRIQSHHRERLYHFLAMLSLADDTMSVADLHQQATTRETQRDAASILAFLDEQKGTLPWWQTRMRLLEVAFKADEKELRRLLKDFAKLPTLSDKERVLLKAALQSRADVGSAVNQTEFEIMTSRIDAFAQGMHEHSTAVTGAAIYLFLRQDGYSGKRQKLVLDWAVTANKSLSNNEQLLDDFLPVRQPALNKVGQIALDRGRTFRWITGFARGTAVQGAGRALAVLGGMFLTVSYLPEELLTTCAALAGAEATFRLGAFLYSRVTDWRTASGREKNHRAISLFQLRASEFMALSVPALAYAVSHFVPAPDLPRNEELVEKHGSLLNYFMLLVASQTFARVTRQVFQSATQSNFTRSYSITYKNGASLTDEDREFVNFVRDLLYVISTAVTLGAVVFADPDPWTGAGLSAANEGLDEIWPDVACVLAARWRNGWPGAYQGSNAELRLVKNFSPVMLDNPKQLIEHIGTQAAARITHNGLPDLLAVAGDLARIHDQTGLFTALKVLSIVFYGIYGARRGSMLAYLRDPKNAVPTGLIGYLLRFFKVLDAKGRAQRRPALESEVCSMQYLAFEHRYGDPKALWNWQDCIHFELADGEVFHTFPSIDGVFHIAEPNFVKSAAFNMLALAVNPDLQCIEPMRHDDLDFDELLEGYDHWFDDQPSLKPLQTPLVAVRLDWDGATLTADSDDRHGDAYACICFDWKDATDALFIVCGDDHGLILSSRTDDLIALIKSADWREAAERFFKQIKLPAQTQVSAVSTALAPDQALDESPVKDFARALSRPILKDLSPIEWDLPEKP